MPITTPTELESALREAFEDDRVTVLISPENAAWMVRREVRLWDLPYVQDYMLEYRVIRRSSQSLPDFAKWIAFQMEVDVSDRMGYRDLEPRGRIRVSIPEPDPIPLLPTPPGFVYDPLYPYDPDEGACVEVAPTVAEPVVSFWDHVAQESFC